MKWEIEAEDAEGWVEAFEVHAGLLGFRRPGSKALNLC